MPLTASPFFWLVFLFALGLGAPFVPVPSLGLGLLGTVLLTLVYVTATAAFAATSTRRRLPWPVVLSLIVLCAAIWCAVQFGAVPKVGLLLRAMARHHGHPSPAQHAALFGLMTAQDLALLAGAVLFGSLVARLVNSPNMVGPICAVVAMIDVWGVLFGGPVSRLLANPVSAPIAHHAMTHGPLLGLAAHSKYAIRLPEIGIGDYLFLGLLFAVLHLHGMNWRGAFKLVVPLITIALLVVVFAPAVPALPGLLPIGLGMALPNLKYFEYTREEKFALLYAGLFVLLLTGVVYVVIMRSLPPPRAHHRPLAAAPAHARSGTAMSPAPQSGY